MRLRYATQVARWRWVPQPTQQNPKQIDFIAHSKGMSDSFVLNTVSVPTVEANPQNPPRYLTSSLLLHSSLTCSIQLLIFAI
ncbi:hypothetical protein VNO78_16829 [Psophocarpus tetragonolobus]|uniref:Uncharacterized protein n=1 Tax=Psophocarpus tetragonolobus TaxID=3891 RepID=A0AAN9SHA6_PSOTE